MSDERKLYKVVIGGVEHEMLLSADDAKRLGDSAVPAKQAPVPANKARTPKNKGA